MAINKLFEGQHLRLTALNKDDLTLVTQWYKDSEFFRNYDATPAFPHESEKWEQWLADRQQDKASFLFAIRLITTGRLIGWTEIEGILWTQRNAWLSIAIGDPTQRGKGFGTEAVSLLLDYAFNELNLHRIQLTVFAYNQAAIHMYEKLGFTREGSYREFVERDGQRYDMLLYGMLAREWRARSK
jgi:RimJ/RimL family protein N-acetyltransferase